MVRYFRNNCSQLTLLVFTFLLVIFAGIEVLNQTGLFDRPLKDLFVYHISRKYSSQNPSDWFPIDSHILPDEYYDIYNNRSEVSLHCSGVSVHHLANVITLSSVTNNGLSWMGGTGHWFHFSERILPMLSEAYDKVWGPTALLHRKNKEEIYIVFEEKYSVDNLGSFNRFFLTAILTGQILSKQNKKKQKKRIRIVFIILL